MSEVITINTGTGTFNQKKESYNPQWNVMENLMYFQNTVEKELRGWFFPYDHALFHMIMKDIQRNVQGDVAEIGVAYGRSAIAVSNYRLPEDKLYLFDLCIDVPQEEASNNINKFGTGSNIEWRIGDTTTLTPETLHFDRPLRFLHIDGSHEHGAVYKDLLNFSSKMADGGVIVMDDYNDQEYPGVNSGTLQFLFENPEWVLFAIGQNKAYMCQREHCEHYMNTTLIFMDLYNKFGLQFGPRLRGVNERNVLLCCSREAKSFDEVRENLSKSVSLT